VVLRGPGVTLPHGLTAPEPVDPRALGPPHRHDTARATHFQGRASMSWRGVPWSPTCAASPPAPSWRPSSRARPTRPPWPTWHGGACGRSGITSRAVAGRFTDRHAFMIAEHLSHLDDLEEALERVSTEVAQRLQRDVAALDLLDAVPGIGRRAADIILAELGADLSRFPSAKHLASWAGCPLGDVPGPRRERGHPAQRHDPHGQQMATAGADRNCPRGVQHEGHLPGGAGPGGSPRGGGRSAPSSRSGTPSRSSSPTS
jgi:hypothetical protein